MLKRDLVTPPEPLNPVDEWRIVETRFTNRFHPRAETGLSLSKASSGSAAPTTRPGRHWRRARSSTASTRPGRSCTARTRTASPGTGQTIVEVPDGTVLQLYVDDEPLFLPVARMPEYARTLDMRAGVLTRELVWSTPAGKAAGP
jgi:alpha,alpha-trehalose phosphorylase